MPGIAVRHLVPPGVGRGRSSPLHAQSGQEIRHAPSPRPVRAVGREPWRGRACAVIERDSAGARLVANNTTGSGWNGETPWRVTEELAIGSDTLSEEYRFGRIGDLSVAPNGNTAVIDQLSGVVRVFDAAGRHPWVANDDDGVLVLERVAVATDHQGDHGAGRDRT